MLVKGKPIGNLQYDQAAQHQATGCRPQVWVSPFADPCEALTISIDRSTVSKIVTDFKKTEERRQKGEEEVTVTKPPKSGVARYPEVDTAVGLFIDDKAARGLTTTPEEVHDFALKVAAKAGHLDFKASVKWADNVRSDFCPS